MVRDALARHAVEHRFEQGLVNCNLFAQVIHRRRKNVDSLGRVQPTQHGRYAEAKYNIQQPHALGGRGDVGDVDLIESQPDGRHDHAPLVRLEPHQLAEVE